MKIYGTHPVLSPTEWEARRWVGRGRVGKAAIWDDWLFYVDDYAGWSGLGGAQRADSWLVGILVLLARDGGCAYCGITAAIGARQD